LPDNQDSVKKLQVSKEYHIRRPFLCPSCHVWTEQLRANRPNRPQLVRFLVDLGYLAGRRSLAG
jgi:hypothetical protein